MSGTLSQDPSPKLKPKPDDGGGSSSNSRNGAIKHVILIGACYVDTVLTVPHFPEEDSKLRATDLQVRRGGNCPNTLEVLHQLLVMSDQVNRPEVETAGGSGEGGVVKPSVIPCLVSSLPARQAAATSKIMSSFGGLSDESIFCDGGSSGTSPPSRPIIDFSHCLYREGHQEPASSYIIRTRDTSSRTIVNYNDLPEMTASEFVNIADAFVDKEKCDSDGGGSWWHFEGRIPATTLQCIRYLRQALPAGSNSRISVEVEKPNRDGLEQLAAEADVVFYSRSWAESRGYTGPEACLRGEATKTMTSSSGGASLMVCTWGAQGASGLFRSATQKEGNEHGEWKYMQYRANPSGTDIRVVDTIGAGDTFIAGMLFGLVCHASDWSQEEKLAFSTNLATKKVQMDGFAGLVTRDMVYAAF